jgi:hypothetical protein
MKTLHVEPVPVPLGNSHPKVNAVLPQHEFSMGLIGKSFFIDIDQTQRRI